MEHFSPYVRLQEHARRQPCEDAIVRGNSTLAYDAFLDRVISCAGDLLHQGFVPNQVTGICVRDTIEHLVCAMALMCMGTPQMSLGSHELGSTKRALTQKVGIGQVIADEASDWMEGLKVIRASSDSHQAAGIRPDNFFGGSSLDTVVLYQNTSGSTGIPKTFGISLDRLLRVATRYANDPKNHRTLRGGSIEFDAHRMHRIASLIAGNTCVFARGHQSRKSCRLL